MNPLSLYELNTLVRDAIAQELPDTYWVQGELSEGRVGAGGHFYGELVQRDEVSGEVVAKARVNCWASTYVAVSRKFESLTDERLRAGLAVLLEVRVTFHPQYGYSLSVQDIDPSYTLGDAVRRRMQILAQLEADGILHDNQQLPMPVLPRRIAVVSSPQAAGYGDFCKQVQDNDYGYSFQLKLFPALMQGRGVEESVIAALEQIADEADQWDVVVIIRGGGATSDLSDFDSYPLAACVALMPLPVITGIGHERDETVLDHVAHTHLKTPTAVGAFLIERMVEAEARLEGLAQRIAHATSDRLSGEKQRILRLTTTLPMAFRMEISRRERGLEALLHRLSMAIRDEMQGQVHRIDLLEQRLRGLDPDVMLKRGYSISLVDGHLVTDISSLAAGQELVTRTYNGEITSTIKTCKTRK